MKLCDLHTHSTFSDGTLTPEELIQAAVALGLAAIALCDHNTVDGIPDFLRAAKNQNIEAIAGAEFSVDYKGKELHLLGLYIPEEKLSVITEQMAVVNRRKEESNIALIASLDKAGYHLDYREIKSKTPKGMVNRAHIGAALTEKGYTTSIKEAFATLLSPEAGHYVAPERLSVFTMIELLRQIGAVPVLAHPFLNLSPQELQDFLPAAKACGLAGMECYYSSYDAEKTVISLAIAARFGLLVSGGSDFHGSNKPKIKLGSGEDNLQVPYTYAQAIAAARN